MANQANSGNANFADILFNTLKFVLGFPHTSVSMVHVYGMKAQMTKMFG